MSSDRYPTKQTHLRRPPDFTPAYQSSPLNPNRPAGSSRSPRTPTHAMPVVRELFLEFDNIRFPGSDVLIPPGGHMPSVAEELEIRMHAYTRRLNANDNYGWRSPPSLADQFPRTPKSPRAHRLPRTPKSPRTPESSSASPSSPECYRTYADPPLSPKSPRPLPTPPGRLPEPPSPTWQIPGDLSPLWHTPRHAPSIGEVIDGTFLTDESAPPANVDRAGRVPEPIPASSASDFFEVQDARNYRTTMRTLAGRYIDFRKDTGLEKMQLESERRMRSMNYEADCFFRDISQTTVIKAVGRMCGLPSVQSGIRVHSSMTDGYQFPLAEAVGVQLPSPLSEGMEYGKAVMRSVGRALRVLLRDHETYDLSLPMLPISLPLFTPPDILWLLVHTGDNVFLDILRIVMFTMRRGCQDTIRGIVLSLLLSRVTDEMLTRRASFEQQEDDDWIMEGPSSAGTADAAQAESRGHAELLLSRAEESTPIVRDKGKGRAAGERNEEANILELRLEEPTEEDEALSEEMEVDDEDQEDEGAEASTTSKAKGREVNDEDQEGGGAELDTTSKAEDEGRSFQHAEQDLFVPPEPSWAWHVWALEQRLRVEGNRWRLIKGDARLPRDLQPVAWEEIRALLPASPIP